MVPYRTKRSEEGESSSTFFLRLVKMHSVDRNIVTLRADDGSVFLAMIVCACSFAPFFLVFFLHLLVIMLLRLTCSQVFLRSCLLLRELTVRAFSVSQRFAVLRGIAHGRTPGCDSLHMKFYPRFWSILGADLVLVLNSAFASDLMSRSQRLGVITLSLKKGDRLDPQ